MTERDFLMNLKAGLVPCPGDIDQVLILVDWLDENGEAEKADWIRQQVKEGGIPHFDEEIQPDLFFRCGTEWKVFRNGRPGRIDVGVYHLVDRFNECFDDQDQILRGLIIAMYDQGEPDQAIWYQAWIEDVETLWLNPEGRVMFELSGQDFLDWHKGPVYYEGYTVQSIDGREYFEHRRYPES